MSETADYRDAHPHCHEARSAARHDWEYKRNGTRNMFMLFAPLEGWRHVEVTERRTSMDYANILKVLSDEMFPDAEKITLVQGNLNTHKPASLYEAFKAPEARRLTKRFEWHYTPKHGSWLNLSWLSWRVNVSIGIFMMGKR